MDVGYVPGMELRHLRSFAAAAERQRFTRAAESLKLTQAAVSQHIATLEKELETELFDRKGRGVSLTVAGRRMYEYARQILDLVAEATSQVAAADQQVSGILRVATSSVPSEWLVPELLAEFRSRYPEVRESLTVSDSRVATLAVESWEVDVGFVGELPHSSTLEAQAIAEHELVLVVAADHPFAEKGVTTLKQLIREPLIVREPGSGTRRCIEKAMEEQGVSPSELHIAMEINSNEAIRAAVERRAGVAFLSQRDKRHETGLVTIAVRGFHPRRQLYFISNPDRALPTPARQFLAFVEAMPQAHPARNDRPPGEPSVCTPRQICDGQAFLAPRDRAPGLARAPPLRPRRRVWPELQSGSARLPFRPHPPDPSQNVLFSP